MITGKVTPAVGSNTIEVTAFGRPQALRAKFSRGSDSLEVVRQFGSDWDIEVDDYGKEVRLSNSRKTVVLSMPGIYGVRGNVSGTVTVLGVTE